MRENIQNFSGKADTTLENSEQMKEKYSNWFKKNTVLGRGVDVPGSRQGPVALSCENSDEASGTIKEGNLLSRWTTTRFSKQIRTQNLRNDNDFSGYSYGKFLNRLRKKLV
jgi:hypothetical protein